MNKPLISTILIRLALAGGGWLFLAKGGDLIAGAGFARTSDNIDWDVGYPKNKIDPALEATAIHEMSGGGRIFMAATCDTSAISINFEYHAKDDSASAFKAQGTYQYVHILYRLDQGEVQDTASSTGYKNSADADFSYGSDEPSAIKGWAPWLAPQDLRAFLCGPEATFHVPLATVPPEV